MRVILPAVGVILVATSCAGGLPRPASPVRLGGEWEAARLEVAEWKQRSIGRGFAVQDLDRSPRRLHPPLDSLFVAQGSSRAGESDRSKPVARGGQATGAPLKKAGTIVREHYIFYIRGNLITGIEYRAVIANGVGGYRQVDYAVGDAPGVPPGRT